jgi:hypothetical protein
MRRQQNITTLVYEALFPKPTPKDPPDFASHLARNLVAEVRIETQRFYGGLETVEARYPGLNYSYGPHRKRLARFEHHARLFKAFDELGLTEHEIGMLCRWEGTLWARQRYERDEGTKVVDTTGSEILPWVDRRIVGSKSGRRRGSGAESRRRSIKVKTEIEIEIEEAREASTRSLARAHQSMTLEEARAQLRQFEEQNRQRLQQARRETDEPMSDVPPPAADENDDIDDTESEEIESVGIELNARLIEAVAAREQQGLDGHNLPLDPAYEAYLKEAMENGTLAGVTSTLQAQAIQQALDAARATATPSSVAVSNVQAAQQMADAQGVAVAPQ